MSFGWAVLKRLLSRRAFRQYFRGRCRQKLKCQGKNKAECGKWAKEAKEKGVGALKEPGWISRHEREAKELFLDVRACQRTQAGRCCAREGS